MKCEVCGLWVEIEEPNPTDVGCFVCGDCIDQAVDADVVPPAERGGQGASLGR